MKKCEWFVSSIFRGVGARVSNIMLVSLLVLSDSSFGGETPRCGNSPVSVPLELVFNGSNNLQVGRDVPVGTVIYEETISAGEVLFLCKKITHSIGIQDGPASAHGNENTFPLLGSKSLSWRIRLSGSPEVEGIATRPYGPGLMPNTIYALGPGAFTLYLVKTGEFTNDTVVPTGIIGMVRGGSGYGNTLGLLANIKIRNGSRPIVSSCSTPEFIAVNMGVYVSSDLDSGESKAVPFSIKLSECDDSVAIVKYSFLPATPVLDQSKGVVSLNRGSTARGVGLRITRENGGAVVFGNSYRVDGFTSGLTNFDIPFHATYSRLMGEPLISGTADTELTFVMTYL